MARSQKSLVEPKDNKIENAKNEEKNIRLQKYIELIKIIRTSKKKKEIDIAFNQIVQMMNTRIRQLLRFMKIPGNQPDDLYQEALFALQYKAIKGYNQDKSKIHKISSFESFATLCIKRYLSTKLKESFQSKHRVQNQAVSLHQNRNNGSTSQEENISLNDIITNDDKDILLQLKDDEEYNILTTKLLEKMSDLEKIVYRLYKQNLSYEEIAKKIYEKSRVSRCETKSIDNSLSRIKQKARDILFFFENEKT